MAIKLECVKTKHPQLHIEAKFYKMMQSGGMCVSACVLVLKVLTKELARNQLQGAKLDFVVVLSLTSKLSGKIPWLVFICTAFSVMVIL